MSSRTRILMALAGVAVVLICESVVLFNHAWATSPTFLLGFGLISALGFWAMSLHPLKR